MQKQAPSIGRIFVMVLFALSCFGILLYLATLLPARTSVPHPPSSARTGRGSDAAPPMALTR